jgi:hypothetical protein
MKKQLLATLLALAALDAAGQALVVEDAWVRAMPPAQRMTAAYMTLRNTGDAPVVVESVRSEGAAEASLHATRRDGDRVRMEAIDKLTVDPGATVELAPGAMHVMIMGMAHMPAVGETRELCLQTNVGEQCFAATVRTQGPGDHSHH